MLQDPKSMLEHLVTCACK